MRLRWGAGAAAGADLAGMAAAALVTFVNGLAFGFLCFVMIGVILVAMVAEAGVGEGWRWIVWISAAWLLTCCNIVVGLKTMEHLSWQRLLWLYGSTGAAILLYPGTHRLLF